MNQSRLEGVLTRNRRQLVLDVALAAVFLMALLLSGLAFGAELPKLSLQPRVRVSPAAEIIPSQDEMASFATFDEPQLAAR